ncbi:MAG: hypothetical protein NTV12_06950, partial [Verrucomicrobia bacterium]|nr:hypothetical protein [Verrucomicrobiota bacterium]
MMIMVLVRFCSHRESAFVGERFAAHLLLSSEREKKNHKTAKTFARRTRANSEGESRAVNLVAGTVHFPIVTGSKTTMTPQDPKMPQQEPPAQEDQFICDKAAVVEIYPQIQAFIISRLGWQIGEDVAHEAIGAILNALPKIKANTLSGFRGFCFRVAR